MEVVMPGQKMNSIKNRDQYESLRDEGMSKEKAARIANSSNASQRGGKASSYEDMTKDEVYESARRADIEGRSTMTKNELIRALREN
jgi:hypothetical protein